MTFSRTRKCCRIQSILNTKARILKTGYSFESKEPNVVRWIPGKDSYAHDLTKRNLNMIQRLYNICVTKLITDEHQLRVRFVNNY